MKRLIGICTALALVALVGWCWLYRAYDEVAVRSLDAFRAGEPGRAIQLIEQYRNLPQARALARLRLFRDRIDYTEAVARASIGDEQKSAAAFTRLVSAAQTGIAGSARYNKAHYGVRTGALEEARDHYRKVLVLDPDDLQAKINLELLLVRMQDEAEAAKKLADKGQIPQQQMSDYWSREQSHTDAPSGASKRIWK